MKYFKVSLDKSYINIPRMKSWKDYAAYEKIYTEPPRALPDRFILHVEGKKEIVCPDVLEQPVFMVSEEAYNMIKLFEPNLEGKEVIIAGPYLDIDIDMYYIPLLEKADCLTEDCVNKLYRKEQETLCLKQSLIPDKAIFRIPFQEKNMIIMRLDLVESLLRRDIFGLKLEETNMLDH